jgi:hypothetical protein
MIAITTNNSISVKARFERAREGRIGPPREKEHGTRQMKNACEGLVRV